MDSDHCSPARANGSLISRTGNACSWLNGDPFSIESSSSNLPGPEKASLEASAADDSPVSSGPQYSPAPSLIDQVLAQF